MIRPLYILRGIFGNGRGLRLFFAHTFIAFGLVSATIQFIGQLMSPTPLPAPAIITTGAIGTCMAWGFAQAVPRKRVVRQFRSPDFTVTIEVGDLFEQDAHLVVGFTDTFDTALTQSGLISRTSIQGQLTEKLYGNDGRKLGKELASALEHVPSIAIERRKNKRKGKLTRYPIGTVAVLGGDEKRVFGVAYSRMGNDLVAKATVDDLWFSLGRLWDAVYQHGHRGKVAMPLIGSGLARVDYLNREGLLRIILLSFVARSRQRIVCPELHIVIRPSDLDKLNLTEIASFVRTL